MAVSRTGLCSSLELENWQQITQYILQNLEVSIDGQTAKSLPEILQLMGRKCSIDFKKLEETSFPHNGFKKGILYMAQGDLDYRAKDILEKYLLGYRIALSGLRNYGLIGVKEPLSNRNAESVFKTVTTFLWKAGLKGTNLLFDETEKTLVCNSLKPPGRITKAANLMRRLIDSTSNRGMEGVLIVYTVLPGFVERATQGYAALGQRLRISNDDGKHPWRSPVINNTSVNSYYTDREQFLNAIVSKLNHLTIQCGVNKDITKELEATGKIVLSQKAGEEYKRDLMKALTSICIRHIEGDEVNG